MKTLILYATKHETTADIAKRIAAQIDGAVIHDLKQTPVPSMSDYDCIIIGSSVYIGKIRKEAKAFLSQNADMFREKMLGIFLCGLTEDEKNQKVMFETNIPRDILKMAEATAFVGGIFEPEKFTRMERWLIKVGAGRTESANTVNDDEIQRFIDTIKENY